MGVGGAGVGGGGGGSGRLVLIDNGRVYQSKAADALVQVKTTKFGTNVGLNMLLNISSRYFGGLFWSRQLRGLPSSDGYFCNCDTVTQLAFKHNLYLFCLKNLSIFSWVSWSRGNHDTSLKYTDEWNLWSQQILYLCVFLHLRVRMCLCNQQLLIDMKPH